MLASFRHTGIAGALLTAMALPLAAGQAKLDADTCTQLRGEQVKFVQTGILADFARGPDWGKANLSADRLREIEHYIMLDEQLKFGCREAVLTPEAARASEIAKRLEINSDADPTVPVLQLEPGTPGANDDGASATAPAPAKPKVRKPKSAASKKAAAKASPAGNADTDAAAPKSAPVAETPGPAVKSGPTAVP